MSLIDVLTEKDKEMITAYIDWYACEDSGRTASVEHLLRFWDEAKSGYLYKLLGNQLTVTKPVTFKQDIDETAEEVRRAIQVSSGASEFLARWRREFGWRGYGDPNACTDDLPEDVRYELYAMLDMNILASNVWDRDTFIVPFPDGTNFKVQRGAKVSKAIGKIVKGLHLSEDLFEDFRIACSQGLNQRTLKGELTLSIHPLDYMTMSDNNCDWSSCMSWKEHGCYRQGTVEMMNSPMVIVAYLAADEPMRFASKYEWNSKKWRELMIVTPDIICNVLGYPYRNSNLSKAAVDMIKELAEKNCEFSYKNEKPVVWIQRDKFYPFGEEEDPVCVYTETYNMYNDFSDREHFGYFNEYVAGDLIVNYSGHSECMSCGMADPEIDEEGFLVGNCCEEVYYCDVCGERIYSGDNDYYIDDMHMCQYCAEDRTAYDIYGEEHYDENLREITLIGENCKSAGESVYVYYSDWDKRVLKRYFKRFYGYKRFEWDIERFFVQVKDLTKDGLELFYERTGCNTPEELEDLYNNEWVRHIEPVDLDEATEYLPDKIPRWW